MMGHRLHLLEGHTLIYDGEIRYRMDRSRTYGQQGMVIHIANVNESAEPLWFIIRVGKS
jgi:hypothetical protein